ncbi:MAG: exodeoxyribonuclease III [Ectothiorhodospiraceae bacterium]|nr:exodeoxyribonuclease III [Ectothiorhodospiraceae bacterium]
MKIATWNVNSLNVRLPHVLDWLATQAPDVLALQETKLTDDKFPVEALAAAGYRALFAGQKTYNGVALLTREAATDPLTDIPDLDDPDRRILIATVGGVRVVNLYVVNGQEVGSEKYAYKLEWLRAVTAHVARELEQHRDLVVVGDFNITPDDRDVHDPDAWRERILCSTPEREALGRLLALGLTDAFRLFEQAPASFSWWDYRQGAFRRNLGLRIDLVLPTTALGGRCTGCTVDTAPRRLERPSDHAPVVAEFDL